MLLNSALALFWLSLSLVIASGYAMYSYTDSHTSFVANPGNAVTRNLAVNRNGSSIVVVYNGVNMAYLSNDYGTTWSPLAGVLANATYLVAGSMSSTGQYLYLAGYSSNFSARIHVSTDYGSSWSLSTYLPTEVSFPYSISTDETGRYVVLSTEAKRILLSRDYGSSFTTIYNSSYAVNEVVVTTNGYIYFCDSQGVYRGTTSSTSFTPKKALSHICYSLSASVDGQVVYMSDGWGIHSSFDYGNSWSTFGGVFASSASSSSDGSVVAMLSPFAPMVSTDFGATWTAIDPNEEHYFDAIRVAGLGSRVYLITQSAASQDGLYVIAASSSVGVSPSAAPSPTSAADEQATSMEVGVIVGIVIAAIAGLALLGFVVYMGVYLVYGEVALPPSGASEGDVLPL